MSHYARTSVALLVLAALATSAQDISPRFVDRAAFDRFVGEGRDSPFGLDYVFVHGPGARNRALVDSVTDAMPVRWVNFAKLEWRAVERRAPVGGRHTWDWSEVDGAVRAWQRNGVHIMMSMRFNSPWATAPKRDEFVYLKGMTRKLALAGADHKPKPEHEANLQAYVRALVERYDGDGQDDMPGLLFPILHYQVGNEYYNQVYWAGTVEEYGVFLRQVAGAARAACPDVRILLSGIGFEDIHGFYGIEPDAPAQAHIDRHRPKMPAQMAAYFKRADAFTRASAAWCDAYDILDARWPNYGIVARSRELLREVGCSDKEVWSAEIYSGFPLMEPLILPNWTLQAWPTPSKSVEYIRILKSRRHPRFDEINTWYRGLQAAHVVKLCMVALDAGSQKLMMGWAVDAQHPLGVSTLPYHGLYSATFNKMWPAGYTYGLTIRKLDGLQRIRRLPADDMVYLYDCTVRDGAHVLVAFVDDRIGQNCGVPTAEIRTTIPCRTPAARVTPIITRIDQTAPDARTVHIRGGALELTLTEYPVFIEPIHPSR